MSLALVLIMVSAVLLVVSATVWAIRRRRRQAFVRAVRAIRGSQWRRAIKALGQEIRLREGDLTASAAKRGNLTSLAGFRALKTLQLVSYLGDLDPESIGELAKLVKATSDGDRRLFSKVTGAREKEASNQDSPIVTVLPYMCVSCFSGLTEGQVSSEPRCKCGSRSFLVFRQRVIPDGPVAGRHFILEFIQKG